MKNISKIQRSYLMSKIRSEWTKPEKIVHNWLKGHKIRHKMHPKIEGKPDVLLIDAKTAIFINGCFWHKCPRCYKPPKSNKSYWLPKIERNAERDKKSIKALKKLGFKVIIIWEHDIKNQKFAKLFNAFCLSS